MFQNLSRLAMLAALGLAALLAPAQYGQVSPPSTCNGLPVTIVATTPGLIMGTPGDDVIIGTAGDDQIFGLGGNDTICGGGGNDQITGGQGQDQLFGQAGNDTFFWNPGDGNDTVEGGGGIDTLQVAGANVSEVIDLSNNGNRLRFTRNIANIVLDVAGVERVNFTARGGTDLISVNRLVGTGVQQVSLDLAGVDNTPDGQADSVIVFGGPGDDDIAINSAGNVINITGAGPAIEIRNSEAALDSLSIQALEGNDRVNAQGLAAGLIQLTVEGGPGNDTITGSQGADVLVGGDDNDTFVWPLGTPADLVSGEAGTDTLLVLGSAAADNVALFAAATGVQVLNGDGTVLNADVEQVIVQAGRGADQIAVNTLAGSTLQRITLDLRPSATAAAGDGAADSIVVNGTAEAETISIAGSAGNVTVSGLTPAIVVQGAEGRDTLTVNGGAEADVLNAQGLAANTIHLVLRGGQGNDTITGSPGDDLITWFPGDGSDVIEGGAGTDTLQINGANITENVSFTANGSRLRFFRDVAAITLDVNAVEQVKFAAFGGADVISFGDLSGTGVKQIGIDLASSTSPAGDGQPDTIQITSLTASPIATTIGAGTMTISWPPVTITVTGVEPTNDRLVLQIPTGALPPATPSVRESGSSAGSEAGSGVVRP